MQHFNFTQVFLDFPANCVFWSLGFCYMRFVKITFIAKLEWTKVWEFLKILIQFLGIPVNQRVPLNLHFSTSQLVFLRLWSSTYFHVKYVQKEKIYPFLTRIRERYISLLVNLLENGCTSASDVHFTSLVNHFTCYCSHGYQIRWDKVWTLVSMYVYV